MATQARIGSIFLAVMSLGIRIADGGPAAEFEDVLNLASQYCTDCHSGDEPAGKLDLTQFVDFSSVAADPGTWSKIRARVRAGEMPPPDSGMPLPTREQAQWLGQWVTAVLRGLDEHPGPAPLRRLNKFEYNTTIRDLLGVHVQVGQSLPADGGGGAGFDNAAETLFLSPVHAEKYLDAARMALDYMSKDPLARQQIFIAAADQHASADEAAYLILQRFLYRAFRRPVDAAEVRRYLQPYARAIAQGEPFESAVMLSLQAVLVSPHFLFRLEAANESAAARPVSDYELATRLSYFLWSSMPDDELMQLAAAGKLSERTVLREQVLRMLDTRIGNFDRGSEFTKARALAENFVGQWLGTRELGSEFVPDKQLFPDYDEQLEFAMRHEPIYLFEHMLVENRPLLDLLDCDYTHLTRELAALYKIDDAPLRRFGELEYVELPADSDRGGVLTMAAVLTVSSFPDRTSPVLRGKWVLEKLLGAPPPPPPPNVPELSKKPEDAAGKTLRERLEVHRQDATCAACHDRLDPLGFGLENYDAIGRWRSEDAGQPVDARGTLPSGVSYSGPQELKQVLLARKDDFVRMFCSQMLSYALGRGLVDSDFATLERIVERLQKHDYQTQELILGIVECVPFRYQPARAGD